MSLPPGTRLRILCGNPTDEELAVLVLALDLAVPGPVPAAAPDAGPGTGSAWQRAARLEGLGAAPLLSADDPRLVSGR